MREIVKLADGKLATIFFSFLIISLSSFGDAKANGYDNYYSGGDESYYSKKSNIIDDGVTFYGY